MRRWTTITVLGVSMSLGLAACGGSSDDTSKAQDEMRTALAASPYGVGNPDVTCPSGLQLQQGQTFNCQAKAGDGSSATVAATPQDSHVTIQNLVPVQSIASQCNAALNRALRGFPGTSSCTVNCPDLVVASPNGTLNCQLESTSGASMGTVRIPLDASGKAATGTWHANVHL